MKQLILILLMVSGLFASSASECNEYENKFYHYLDKTNTNAPSYKKYSMLMVKSYFDSIILECRGTNNYGEYRKMIPKIKKMWKDWIPEETRNQSQNQWKY